MTEEEKRRHELSDEFAKQLNVQKNKAYNALTEEQRNFMEYCGAGRYFSNGGRGRSPLADDLREWLKGGKKPSEFFRARCGWLFDGCILPRKQEMFYYTVDHITRWQYSTDIWRRSFRTAHYFHYTGKILKFIRELYYYARVDADLSDRLTLNLPEKERAYVQLEERWFGCGEEIAYELDRGNQKVMDALKDIMNGEGGVTINHNFIRGIVMSSNAEMHEYLGKLLLAARLQEGFRQAICESADCGTTQAFLTIFKVIEDNNLIRFSSVKRAVGTWTGLMSSDSGDIERISAKTVRLIADCLEHEEARENYLKSEDSMEIYLSLWAYGFYEVKDAIVKFEEIVDHGTHHQLLTAGYFAANVDSPSYAHGIAKRMLAGHSELDIIAVFLPYFMDDWFLAESFMADEKAREEKLQYYFESRDEAEWFYQRLKELSGAVKKKTVFSPCIFPWYSVELERSALIGRMSVIACILHDNNRIDECVSMLKDCDSTTRRIFMATALQHPETDMQRAALVNALCDKDSYNRRKAAKYVEEVALEDENYLQMEQMLRFKSADMRAELINLLYKREDGAVFETARRLCADKLEEKRTAGLDIIIRLSKDEERAELFQKCKPIAESISNPSVKEKILIENITGAEEKAEKPLLYSEADAYKSYVPDNDFTVDCVKTFMEYFPDSEAGNILYPKLFKKSVAGKIAGAVQSECSSHKQAAADIEGLCALINEHREDEFTNAYSGEKYTMDCQAYMFTEKQPDGTTRIPFYDMWVKWYEDNIKSPARLLRMEIALAAYMQDSEFAASAEKYVESLYGKGFGKNIITDYRQNMTKIVSAMHSRFFIQEDWHKIAAAAELWFMKAVPEGDVMIYRRPRYNGGDSWFHLITHKQLNMTIAGAYRRNSEHCMDLFALDRAVYERCINDKRGTARYGRLNSENGGSFAPPSPSAFIYHTYRGMIPERTLYAYIFGEELQSCLSIITAAACVYREEGRAVSGHGGRSRGGYYRMSSNIASLLGHSVSREQPFSDEDRKLLAYADKLYDTVIPIILETELRRGDSATSYSFAIKSIQRIYGLENFIAILSALGKEPLERSNWKSTESKKGALSHLLAVCIPGEEDSAKKLGELLKETDIKEKRLIEAGLYAPEWLEVVEEYLGWKGFRSACYYFMAHMNEAFDDRRAAIIAKYTPLTPEELHQGAFDIDWFRSAYEALGEKRFNMIYDAAKYISDGAKHSRARKYADAALGKLEPGKTAEEISAKRNKDLLMAYAVIPIGSEDELCGRYLFLQKFLKESRKFGSQRSASEKKAVEVAMQNLATNAGYADVTRLSLRMETKVTNDSRELFEDKAIGDVVVRLAVDESGKSDLICEKGGKRLKAIPAGLKKNEYIVRLGETKKKLTEQYRRTRQMFEQAMEDGDEFTVEEINALLGNPVAKPILCNLVYQCGRKLGFINGNSLVDFAGKKSKVKPEDRVKVAHPFALYSDGHWADYQRYLFDRQLVQPFKQVFRELYVKTGEEAEMAHSLRYAGNQIQPAKTVACLKARRWVADVEDGLQKVYYRENIVAQIYAMADWFSPADIEAPTLEWVVFSDRKTGREIVIKDVPDVIFSEVMRDVDLAVSVAHAGGVDPETSHSTIEMRAALLEFTLPLFKLTNVEIKGSHAHIKGKLAEYTLHLGSGVVHKAGGAMIPILPVHSQHRGKLFLPFADDDPKTAEILSKALLLAEDNKIKDPMILEQIRLS